MEHLGELMIGILRFLDIVGDFVRRILFRSKRSLMEEYRSRDTTRLRAATMMVIVLMTIVLGGCSEGTVNDRSAVMTTSGVSDSAISVDTSTKTIVRAGSTPVTGEDLITHYLMDHTVPPIVRSIANGGKLDLSGKDGDCLLLLDSMTNGSGGMTRLFYFLIVSKTLKWSDGYYSEGVGHSGTSFLFDRPTEFLSPWWNVLEASERNEWVSALAGEQAIVSEGSACDTVMSMFRSRLKAAIPKDDAHSSALADVLATKVDSVLRLYKAEE